MPGTIPLVFPTVREVEAALSHPDSGRSRFGWEDLEVHDPLSPLDMATANRGSADRRTLYVVDYEAYLNEVWALDPIQLVQAQLALGLTAGLEYSNRMHSRFGFIPGAFFTPDSEAPMANAINGKIVLGGTFGVSATTAVEEWSCSMSYDVVGPDVGAMPVTLPEGTLFTISQTWGAFFASTGDPTFSDQIQLTEVAYYRQLANGKADGGTWQRFTLPFPAAGTNATQAARWPLSVAVAVTLDGHGAPKGRFGRFYLPAPAMVLTNGLMSTGNSEAILAAITDTLATVNAELSSATGDTVETVIASAIGSGENRPVRELRVGRVPDTIRARRRSLPEGYAVAPFQAV